MKNKRLVASALLLGALGASLIATPATAATSQTDSPTTVTPESVRDAFSDRDLFYNPGLTDQTATGGSAPGAVTLRAAAFTITCVPSPEAPHVSSTAGLGVIYKTRVSCTGTGSYPATASVRVKGGLFFDAASSPSDTGNISFMQVKTSNETRSITINGAAATFYTPQVGTRGYTGTGFYQGTSTVEILSPAGFKTGAATTSSYWRKPLG